jgi:histidinol-phosphate aminotransferase
VSQPKTRLNISELVGARVRGMQEYAPEPLAETAQRLGVPMDGLIKLDANENPYGPTDRAARVLREYTEHHRYPDPISRRLRQAIGAYIGVDPAQILVGNGSDELIDLLLRLFRPPVGAGGPSDAGVATGKSPHDAHAVGAGPGATSAACPSPSAACPSPGGGIAQVVDCPPTFGMYAFYGVANDMQVIQVPRLPDYAVDLAAIEGLCRQDPQPKVLFVASPNNPDGQLLPEATLQRLLALPLLVVLDEAYIEFAGGSRADWVADHDNLVVLRTFSKWAGLAGLRVGYGVFPPSLVPFLLRLKSPYNVNGAAQAAALATLEDVEQALQRVRLLIAERQRLYERLRALPVIQPHPSAANYILCRVRGYTLDELRQRMEARGILLRYYGRDGLEQCIRISVGTPEQNDAVIAALQELSARDRE